MRISIIVPALFSMSMFAQAPIPSNSQAYFAPSAKLVLCNQNFNRVEIGWEYIESNGLPFPSVAGCPFTTCVPEQTSPQGDNFTFHSDFISSERQYYKIKNINVSAEADYCFGTGEVGASGMVEQNYSYENNSNTIYWYVDYLKISDVKNLANYKLTTRADSLRKVNPSLFREEYGEYYVATIAYGQSARIIFSYSASNETDANEARIAFGIFGSYMNSDVAINSTANETIKTFMNSTKLHIDIQNQGVDATAFLTFIKTDPKTAKDNFYSAANQSQNKSSPVVLGIRGFFGSAYKSNLDENVLINAISWHFKLEKQTFLLDKIYNSDRFSQLQKDTFFILGQKQAKERWNDSLYDFAHSYYSDPNKTSKEVLRSYIYRNEKSFRLINIPDPYIKDGIVTKEISTGGSIVIHLILEANTTYIINFSSRIEPVDYGSGYMEGNANFQIPALQKSINSPSFLRLEGQNTMFTFPGEVLITTSESNDYYCQLSISDMKWSDPAHQIRSQNYRVTFHVTASKSQF